MLVKQILCMLFVSYSVKTVRRSIFKSGNLFRLRSAYPLCWRLKQGPLPHVMRLSNNLYNLTAPSECLLLIPETHLLPRCSGFFLICNYFANAYHYNTTSESPTLFLRSPGHCNFSGFLLICNCFSKAYHCTSTSESFNPHLWIATASLFLLNLQS